jgi:hypothetical protein
MASCHHRGGGAVFPTDKGDVPYQGQEITDEIFFILSEKFLCEAR